jgi:hypothetical protein
MFVGSGKTKMKLQAAMLISCALTCSARAQAPAAAPAAAQNAVAPAVVSATRVHGTITDPDGELIPGATVTLTPVSGQKITATSGSDGTYSVATAPGVYSVLVTMPGFASYSATGVRIPAVVSTTLDAKLQIGVQTQVITVEATAVQLSVDPDSNQSATILTGKDLEALSDDPDELSSELTALAGPSAGPNGGQIYVDGFTGGQLPPKSSIREIRINQNPFSAQYDRLGFGRIEVFTKPGTDKLHGSFQMNGDPSQFNSVNPLEAGIYVPPYHTIFSFGSLTGPLSKIASYNLGGSYRAIQDDAFTNIPQIYATGANATMPCAPGATGCNFYSTQISTNTPQTRFDISPRVDLAIGDKNVLTARIQYVQNDQHNQGIGNLALPESAYTSRFAETELQMSDAENFSSKLINEIHFEYDRSRSTTTALSDAPTVNVLGSFTSGGSGGQDSTDHEDHFEFQNYTSLQLKKNFIRLGGRLRTTREAQNSYAGTNGLFNYSTLTDYQNGTPSQFDFTQLLVPKVSFTLADLGLYAESDWKVKPNVSVSYGIRYETQNHLSDHRDFAPRVSASYGLFSGKGAPKTVLRGGFGIFYDRFGQGNVLTLLKENGTNEKVYTVDDVPTSCSPATFDPASPAAVANCTAGAAVSAVTKYSASPSLRAPYTIQFALGADQQVGRIGTLSFNYIHSQGDHQLATENVGYDPGTASSPDGVINQYFTEGVFKQNQLTINGHVQTSKAISLFGFYSLNSAHGDTSGGGSFVSRPYDLQADYGRTTFDVRQRLFLGGSVTLPKYIQLSPFVIGQSGNPFNVTTGLDNNGDGNYNDRPVQVAAGTPGSKTLPGCGTFISPGTGSSVAEGPINPCTGPALFTFNLRITKTFGFGASTKAAAGNGQGGAQPPGGGHGGPGGGGHGAGFGFGGGGASTGKRYNFAIGAQLQNLFNNEDLATPISTLTSMNFGKQTQLTGGPYTTNSALRRISVQASFNF